MASQMADARVLRTTVEIHGRDGESAIFTATGKAIEFAGFRRAYVEGSDDPQAELEDQETMLPACRVGDRVIEGTPVRGCAFVGLDAKRHETLPPARYTEASLIKELEEEGIGRPSTYASIIDTIERAATCSGRARRSCRSFTAFAVTELLREHFADYVDIGFTAEMEEVLDQISQRRARVARVHPQFYRGDGKHTGLEDAVKRTSRRSTTRRSSRRRSRDGAADPRPHRPLRSVPAAWRGRRRATRRRCPRTCRRPT